MRGCKHLVAGSNAKRSASEVDGVRAVCHADRVLCAAVLRELPLECGDILAQDKVALLHDSFGYSKQVLFERFILGTCVVYVDHLWFLRRHPKAADSG